MSLRWRLREIVAGLFGRARLEREMDEEMRFYLEQLTERHRERGLDPAAARREALREFGTLDHWKERMRRERGGRRLAGFLRDLRHALRSLRRDPGFSIVVIVTLALGIGLNTAVFSVLKAVYLEPLPLPDPDRLVLVNEHAVEQGIGPVAFANYLDWREMNRSFAALGAYHDSHLNITDGEEPVRVRIARVTGSLADVLGVVPMLGRTVRSEDEEGNPVVVLSHRIWNGRYGGDPGLVGRTIDLDGTPHTVIGVMPAGFVLPSARNVPQSFDLFIPMPAVTRFDPRSVHSYQVVARLRNTVSLRAAREEMDSVARQLADRYPETNEGRGIAIDTVHHALFGEAGRQILLILGAAGLVLLIACANIAALQLARTIRQRREFAVRSSLGADQGRIMSQLFGESVLLALVGGAAAFALAAGGTTVLRNLIPPEMPRGGEIGLDGSVFLFALGLAFLSALVFGFVPALSAARLNPAEVLKDGQRSTDSGSRRPWLRTALVTGQFAVSLILADAALLLMQSQAALQRTDPGFGNRSALTMAVSLGGPRYQGLSARMNFYRDLLPRLEGLSGVSAIGAASTLPLEMEGPQFTLYPEPAAAGTPPEEGPLADLTLITGDYFRAQGIPVIRGRALTLDDMLGSSPSAVTGVVVNQALADRLWPGSDPLGRRVSLDAAGSRWMEIVGVVGDMRQRGLEQVPEAELYVPYSFLFPRRMFLVVQSDRPPAELVTAVRRELAALDPTLPVSEIRTMAEILGSQFTRRSFYTTLVGIFAALALVMAAVGVYGTISYSVARRFHEFGIRLALGAQKSEILTVVVRLIGRVAGYGLVVGLIGISLSTRLLTGFVYGIRPLDAPTIAGAALFLAVVGAVASLLPALRATRVSPLVALRQE